jgi:cytochrome c-type biogenesis protein CcmH/NrfF
VTRRAVGLLALAVTLATAAAVPAAACPRASLPDVEDEVMCPVCGTPLNISEAPLADRERAYIRARIAACDTKAQIKSKLVDQFGPAVLALPDASGFDLAAYLVPIAAGLAALGGVGFAALRWRRRPPGPQAAAAAPTGAEARRLDEDLARRDP